MAKTLGTPAIGTPARLDLPALQQALNNVRERFQRLEAAVSGLVSGGASGGGSSTGAAGTTGSAALQAQITALKQAVDGLASQAADAGSPMGPSAASMARLVARIDSLEQEPI